MKRFLRMSYLVAGLGGVGFFVMSILLLGVWPGQALEEQIRQTQPDRPLPLTASEKRGRIIYAREGCAYCHTQQIRYLAKDVARFGAATLAWETIFDYPHLWGTRRIGPDLSREALRALRGLAAFASLCPARAGGRFRHARLPLAIRRRAGSPQAGSPRFVGLSRNARPGSRLGRSRRRSPRPQSLQLFGRRKTLRVWLARFERQSVRGATQAEFPKLARIERSKIAGSRITHVTAPLATETAEKAMAPERPDCIRVPLNLSEQEYSANRLGFSLWNGVAGTAMPAWRELTVADLSAIAEVVRGFHAASAGTSHTASRCSPWARGFTPLAARSVTE